MLIVVGVLKASQPAGRRPASCSSKSKDSNTKTNLGITVVVGVFSLIMTLIEQKLAARDLAKQRPRHSSSVSPTFLDPDLQAD